MERLYTSIPDHLLTFIKDSNTNLNLAVTDYFIWKTSSTGLYTTKTGFQWLLQQRGSTTAESSWKWIWKLPTQQNIRFFFWLAFHDSIPTLHHRGVSPTVVCRVYQSEEETLLHCLRDWPLVERLWKKLGYSNISFFHQPDVLVWLKQGALGPNDTLFYVCIWWAWKARNAKCFNDENISFPRLLFAVLNLAETFKVCFKQQCASINPTREISWFQRGRDGIILNVDGSSLVSNG